MSYEGYEQHICEIGHLFNGDVYQDNTTCPVCDCMSVFHNSVDDTNGYSYGIIPDWELQKLILTKQEVQVCNLGHSHITKEATYSVPKDASKIQYRVETLLRSSTEFVYIRLHDGRKFNSEGRPLSSFSSEELEEIYPTSE